MQYSDARRPEKKKQRAAGTLAPYAVDSGKPYLSSIAKAHPAVTKVQ